MSQIHGDFKLNPPWWFLEPKITLNGQDDGAGEDTLCYTSIAIALGQETEVSHMAPMS